MSLDYQCGDPSALTSYLYDECEPAERRAIEAHLAICTTCAEEVQALRATRARLASWAPPTAALGFRIVASAEKPASERDPAPVLTSPRWWQRPLPAWAQAAAAATSAARSARAQGRARTPVSRRTRQSGIPAPRLGAPTTRAVPASRATPAPPPHMSCRWRDELR